MRVKVDDPTSARHVTGRDRSRLPAQYEAWRAPWVYDESRLADASARRRAPDLHHSITVSGDQQGRAVTAAGVSAEILAGGPLDWREQEAEGRARHGQDVQVDVAQPEEADRRVAVGQATCRSGEVEQLLLLRRPRPLRPRVPP